MTGTNLPAKRDHDEIDAPPAAGVVIQSERAIQEVQAQATLAKRFPRNEVAVHTAIMQACKRKSLAEVAEYAYPRGDSVVRGPSIRLAEAIAQKWGNMLFGWKEVERRTGQSTLLAWAWDLETNTRRDMEFIQPHIRETKKGNYPLRDSRDIYEICANQAQRRVRSCILALIPGDVVEAAQDQCERTLKEAGAGVSILDRTKAIAATFSDYGVTLPMIEKRLGHSIDTISETELITLRRIYTTIKDNQADPWSYFEREDAPPQPEPGKAPPPKAKRGSAGLQQALAPDTPTSPPTGNATAATVKAIDAALDTLDEQGTAAWRAAMESVNPKASVVEQMTEDEAQRVLAALLAYKGPTQ